jgi:hypothetical protein
MALSPEARYLQLGQLLAEMPSLTTLPHDREVSRWLGRAGALIELVGDLSDHVQFKTATDGLTGFSRVQNAQKIEMILYRALAKAELAAPAASQGRFIAAGAEFDAFAAVGKILSAATSDVLVVDPYADATVLTDFVVQASEKAVIRILAGKNKSKSTLAPAVRRWREQYGNSRPLEVRLASDVSLHDRIIQIDGSTIWALGQSLNGLAKRAPTSLIRVDAETAKLKAEAYQVIWDSAAAL